MSVPPLPSVTVYWKLVGAGSLPLWVYVKVPVLLTCKLPFCTATVALPLTSKVNGVPLMAEIRKEKECCRKHWGEHDGQASVHWGGCLMNPIGAPMIVCGVCGNKRCPKATDCELACTGSNELGQVGSIYGIIGKQKG